MNLKERINADFIVAFKAGNKEKKTTLGMLKAAITTAEKLENKELSDVQVLEIVQKYDKNLDQTIDMLSKAGGGDVSLAISTTLEKGYIADYLPKQMTDDEIREEVKKYTFGLDDINNKNKVLGAIMNYFKQMHTGL